MITQSNPCVHDRKILPPAGVWCKGMLFSQRPQREGNMAIEFKPIGRIRSPFSDPKGMPIQPSGAVGVRGTVDLLEEFREGLKDLDGFSHLILLYHFHLSRGFSLTVVPFLDDAERGVFATRAPRRPNPIGLSIVRLERIEGTVLHICNVDVLDNTPLLDIKPFVPVFDAQEAVRAGWLEKTGEAVATRKSDDRFE
jgi:tRNA-Thr(GGU) m(6)t(6)A37 methyltransferase TsaA